MRRNNYVSFIIAIFILLSSFHSVAAQNASQSATIIEVDRLKEKIASKVAEIEPSKKVIIKGKVTEIDTKNKSFSFSSKDKTYTISFPLKTQFFWIKTDDEKLSLSFSNIEVDDELVVIGDEIAGENQIVPKLLFGKSFLKNIVGRVSAIDSKAHLVTVKTLASETTYIVDIAAVTDIMKMIKNHKEQNITIEQLSKNNIVLVKGIMKDLKKNLLTAKSFYLIQN